MDGEFCLFTVSVGKLLQKEVGGQVRGVMWWLLLAVIALISMMPASPIWEPVVSNRAALVAMVAFSRLVLASMVIVVTKVVGVMSVTAAAATLEVVTPSRSTWNQIQALAKLHIFMWNTLLMTFAITYCEYIKIKDKDLFLKVLYLKWKIKWIILIHKIIIMLALVTFLWILNWLILNWLIWCLTLHNPFFCK